mmetsp:Transcript_25478/g.31304  ORF Transcript_25478/g.31304 Transcript_25478/m.31304 type:complete len:99 (+) Transcript_25478:193-489(+)
MAENNDKGAEVLFWVLLIASFIGIIQGFAIRWGYLAGPPSHKRENYGAHDREFLGLQERLSDGIDIHSSSTNRNSITTIEMVERYDQDSVNSSAIARQ